MNIIVNGEDREAPSGASVADLVSLMGLPEKGVAVERNRAVTPKSLWSQALLEEGDRIEIVHFVGGG